MHVRDGSRLLIVGLVLVLLFTGIFQQSLDAYAHDLIRDALDNTTGLTNLRARDYDPLTGRFTTADSQSPNGSFTICTN